MVWRWLGGLWRALSRPMPAALLHGLTLWLWHAPALFAAALEHHWLHALEHACFFGTALLFWRAVLDGRAGRRAGPALAAALVTLVHGGLLGGLITLAPYPLYRPYVGGRGIWGLTPLEDQQLAGLLMWVPLGLSYLAAGLAVVSRLVLGPIETPDLKETTS
jgi:putative membrane protein